MKLTSPLFFYILAIVVIVIAAVVFHTDSTGSEELSAKDLSALESGSRQANQPTQKEIDTLNEALWIHNTNVNTLNEAVWINTTNKNIWIEKTNARLAAEKAARDAARKAAAQATPPTTSGASAAPVSGSGRCGGNLPSCCVMNRESGGDIHAQNPNSTASGKWQFINSTWNNYMGYPTAASAPEWVQDQKAAELYAGGAGASHWAGHGC